MIRVFRTAALAAACATMLAPAVARADNCQNDPHCLPIRAERNIDAALRFVMIGDGFTADQEQAFYQQAQTLFSALQQFGPYQDYQSLFNAYAMFTPSAESGITHQAACGGKAKNTAFQSTFGCINPGTPSQDERMLTTNNSLVVNELSARFSKFRFGRDLVVVIANDTTYGGTGGQVAIISMNVDAPKILFHEAGHTFAHLADEYWTPYPGYPAGDPEPNAAFLGDVASKWGWWINGSFSGPTCTAQQESPPNTPMPIPYTALNPFLCSAATDLHTPVGAYEGARYLPTGVYRPTPYCLMETLWGVQTPSGQTPPMDFCPICREAISLAFDNSAGFIETPNPDNSGAACVQAGGTISANVPGVSTFQYTWTIDGQATKTGSVVNDCPQAANTSTLQTCSLALDPSLSGSHNVTLQIVDSSPAIQKPNTDGIRTKSMQWNVSIGNCDGSTNSGGGGDNSGTDTSGGTSDDGGTMGTAPTPSNCGNGIIEDGEQCDGTVGDATCASVMGDATMSGSLFCGQNCQYDTSFCKPSTCGNGVVDPGEQCDGDDLGGATCATADGSPGPNGTLLCSSLCQFVFDQCSADGSTATTATCGNGVQEQGEDCDGYDFGGATCASVTGDPNSTGDLACTDSCTIDSSGCWSNQVAQPMCGNGVQEQGEQCDGFDFGGATCATVTGDPNSMGTLTCDSTCNIDSSACVSPTCGNGVQEQGEQCDGSDFGGATCASVTGDPNSAGTLACDSTCNVDSSGCMSPVCGNGVMEQGEQCDGPDFGGADCASATGDPTSMGTLNCNSDCTIDSSACMSAMCGDGVVEQGEQCDGSDFGGATCQSVTSSMAATGSLNCRSDCSFDTSACFPDPNCDHGECTTGDPLNASCTSCTTAVCNDTPSCCSDTWDQNCVALAASFCGICN